MMASPAIASLRKALQIKDALVADEPEFSEFDPAMHPLAAQEWLGSYILAALGDPQAVCQLSVINKSFYTASKSNLVWRKLLPPPTHLESLVEDCDDPILKNSASLPLRDLYFHLCKSISLGAGLKKFWLDRRTGGECYILSARALAVAGGSQPEHWKWLPCRGAWFSEVACLHSICWFEISGRFRQLLKPGKYVVSFRMQVRSPSVWRRMPIKLSLQNATYAQPPLKSRVFFHHRLPVSKAPIASPSPAADEDQSVADGPKRDSNTDRHVWVECDVGEFTVEENEGSPIEVEFSMREIEVGYWKRGFLLDGAIIRPSYVVNGQDRAMYGYRDKDDEDVGAFMGSRYGYQDGDDEDVGRRKRRPRQRWRRVGRIQ